MEKISKIWKIKTCVDIEESYIKDMLIDGFEHGIGHWADWKVLYVSENPPQMYNTTEPEDIIMSGGILEMFDVNTGKKLGKLHIVRLKYALHKMAEKYRYYFNDIIAENADTETADVLIQLASMGKIVYG